MKARLARILRRLANVLDAPHTDESDPHWAYSTDVPQLTSLLEPIGGLEYAMGSGGWEPDDEDVSWEPRMVPGGNYI